MQNSPLKSDWADQITTMKKQDDNFVYNLDHYVNILNGKYFNSNFKCMGNRFNKPNQLISTQFNTI